MKKLLCVVTFLALAVPVLAQTPDADSRYSLRIILRCGAHNWLSDQFRDDLRGNLASTLQEALGGMANVEVIDLKTTPDAKWEKWWRDVDVRGLTYLDSVTDATGDKSHFLRIDYRDSRYELQTRQIDASAGLVSPLRREHTEDRAFVARLAGLMIAQDFGIVGMIQGKGDNVTVSFRGGDSPVLPRWVKKGDVLALVRMSAGRGGAVRGSVQNDTYVQLLQDPAAGKAQCRVAYRGILNPLAQSSAGFRCVKLPTTSGPLRLRILDDKGQPHSKALQIRVHSEAFQKLESSEEEVLSPDKSGMFTSRRPYQNLAFVRVVTGASQIAQLPVAIFEDRPAVASLKIDAAAEELGQLQEAKRNLKQQYFDASVVQSMRQEQRKGLEAAEKYEAALKNAVVSRRTLEQDMERLTAQTESLKKEIGAHPIKLDDLAKQFDVFVQYKSILNQTIYNLEQVVTELNSPERKDQELKLRTLFAKGQSHESNFDIDEAIAVYEQIQKEFGEQKRVAERLTILKREWEIKNDAHRAAREFVYREWIKVKTVTDTEAKLPKAKDALQTLKEAGDELTLYKLRGTLPELVKLLTDEIRQLTQSENPDNEAKLMKLKQFADAFDKFVQEVYAALSKKT